MFKCANLVNSLNFELLDLSIPFRGTKSEIYIKGYGRSSDDDNIAVLIEFSPFVHSELELALRQLMASETIAAIIVKESNTNNFMFDKKFQFQGKCRSYDLALEKHRQDKDVYLVCLYGVYKTLFRCTHRDWIDSEERRCFSRPYYFLFK